MFKAEEIWDLSWRNYLTPQDEENPQGSGHKDSQGWKLKHLRKYCLRSNPTANPLVNTFILYGASRTGTHMCLGVSCELKCKRHLVSKRERKGKHFFSFLCRKLLRRIEMLCACNQLYRTHHFTVIVAQTWQRREIFKNISWVYPLQRTKCSQNYLE